MVCFFACYGAEVRPASVSGIGLGVEETGGGVIVMTLLRIDAGDADAQGVINWSHPVRVTACQIIVHGNQVAAAPGESIEIKWQRSYQGLSFTGLQLGDLALMQNNAT